MKISRKALLVGILSVVSVPSFAVGQDYSGITGAVDTGTLLTAITAVAALKAGPGVAKWGYNKLIGWFR